MNKRRGQTKCPSYTNVGFEFLMFHRFMLYAASFLLASCHVVDSIVINTVAWTETWRLSRVGVSSPNMTVTLMTIWRLKFTDVYINRCRIVDQINIHIMLNDVKMQFRRWVWLSRWESLITFLRRIRWKKKNLAVRQSDWW